MYLSTISYQVACSRRTLAWERDVASIIIIRPVFLDSPQYLLFDYPPDVTRVRVKFTSTDDTSGICAIASLQTAYVRML